MTNYRSKGEISANDALFFILYFHDIIPHLSHVIGIKWAIMGEFPLLTIFARYVGSNTKI